MATGIPKSHLQLGGLSLGSRAVGTLRRALGGAPILYSCGSDADVPGDLPSDVKIVPDVDADPGPLAGIESCLRALSGSAQRIVLVPCDMPMLHPAVLTALVAAAPADRVAAVAADDGRPNPFPSVWPASAGHVVTSLRSEGVTSPRAVMESLGCQVVGRSALKAEPAVELVDAELMGLDDCDTADDLAAAKANPPRVRVLAEGRRTALQVWTLGQAADALELAAGSGGMWVLNGRPIAFSNGLPLFERDALSFAHTDG